MLIVPQGPQKTSHGFVMGLGPGGPRDMLSRAEMTLEKSKGLWSQAGARPGLLTCPSHLEKQSSPGWSLEESSRGGERGEPLGRALKVKCCLLSVFAFLRMCFFPPPLVSSWTGRETGGRVQGTSWLQAYALSVCSFTSSGLPVFCYQGSRHRSLGVR